MPVTASNWALSDTSALRNGTEGTVQTGGISVIQTILDAIASFIIAIISGGGYLGVAALMAIEFRLLSAAIRDHHAVRGIPGFHRPV